MKGNNNLELKKKDNKNSKKSTFNISGAEKKKKVSKKGKKNWRKNIDVADFDKNALKKLDENIVQTNAKLMKDEDLFTLDVKPLESVKNKFLREKTEKKKKTKKLSVFEERKIRRMIKHKKTQKINAADKPIETSINNLKNEKVYDLWGSEINQTESIFKFPNSSINQNKNISYPKIPLPHPGQSYNPAEKDVKNLLNKVIEVNIHLAKKDQPEKKEIQAVKLYESSDSEDEEEIKDFKVSNNAPVDDTQRKSRKEKKRLIQKKLNLIKEKEKQMKKQKKKEIATSLGLKRVEKQQKKLMKEYKEKEIKLLNEKKEQEKLIKLGVVEEYFNFNYFIILYNSIF